MRWIDYVGEAGVYIGYASVIAAVTGLFLSWQNIQPAGLVGLFFGIGGASVAMVLGMVVAGFERIPGRGADDGAGQTPDGERAPGSHRNDR